MMGLVGAALTVVAGFNGIVDAYGLFRWVERTGFNANKPLQIFHERIVRGADIPRLEPDALILGTSRSQIGLTPSHPDFRAYAERVYNAALSDGSAYEALRYTQHAHAHNALKLIVVAPDFLSFGGPTQMAPDFTEDRLAVNPQGQRNIAYRFADLAASLLSLDALRASRRTLLDQRLPSYFRPDGQRDEFTQLQRLAAEGGPRPTFVWSERDDVRYYGCFEPFPPGPSGKPSSNGATPAHAPPGALGDFQALLAFAKANGIEVRALTSPSHVRAQLLIEAVGLWEEYERWKREMVEMTSAAGVEWIDFNGADPRFTAEEVPADGEERAMRWYWESSHYRKELGHIVLHRVLTGSDAPEAQGFGASLTKENLEAHLERIRVELANWKNAHPKDWAELEASVAVVRPRDRVRCPRWSQ